MNESLTYQTLRGLNWSYLSTVANGVLQIGFTAVMARLLEPAAFGLVAMAGVVLRFGSYFAQMGIGPALVQKENLSKEDVSVAFTSCFLLSIIFFVSAWLLAPLSTYLFDNTAVIPIIRVMTLSFVLTGLSTTATSLLRRNLEFRSLAIIDIITYGLGYGVVGVVLAFNGFGVWSLVVAALSQGVLSALLAYLLTRHSLILRFRWSYYKGLYFYGSRISVISFLEFIGLNLDTLAIGHLLGATPLGIYNRAFTLVNLPMYHLTTTFSKVLFPSFSRVQSDIRRLERAYFSSLVVVATLVIPICLGAMVASREIVLVVLSEKWSAAIPVLQILAVAAPFSALAHFGGILCDATGNLNPKFFLQIASIAVLIMLFLFLRHFGLKGFAFAVLIEEMLRNTGYIYLVGRILKVTKKELFRAHVPGLAIGVVIAGAILFVSIIMHQAGGSIWMTFSLQLLVGVSLLAVLLVIRPPHPIKQELMNRLSTLFSSKDTNTYTGRLLAWYEKILS